jgi:hypothetical protein
MMKRAISDRGAIEFAIGFYGGLLAEKSIDLEMKLNLVVLGFLVLF